jgi:hypothetical protein
MRAKTRNTRHLPSRDVNSGPLSLRIRGPSGLGRSRARAKWCMFVRANRSRTRTSKLQRPSARRVSECPLVPEPVRSSTFARSLAAALHSRTAAFGGAVSNAAPTGEACIIRPTVSAGSQWLRRVQHRWWWFWRWHAVRHSSTKVDWLAGGRNHPLEGVIARTLTITPLLLAGFEPVGLWGCYCTRMWIGISGGGGGK